MNPVFQPLMTNRTGNIWLVSVIQSPPFAGGPLVSGPLKVTAAHFPPFCHCPRQALEARGSQMRSHLGA